MKNTLIGSLLFFGGVYVSLGTNKTQGTILLLTLLIIVSLSLLFNLSMSKDMEHFDSQFSQFYLLQPNVFNNGAVSPLEPNSNLMAWNIDDQYIMPGGGNRIYEQFAYAVNTVGPTIPIGQKVDLRVNSGGGNSNGSILTIERIGANQVIFRYNGSSSQAFTVPIALAQAPAPAPAQVQQPAQQQIPTTFYLLAPNVFNNGAVSPLVANNNLMAWNIDEQYQSAGFGNRIYEQMAYATREIAQKLQIGQEVALTVRSGGGSSDGSRLVIVRDGQNTAKFIYNNTSQAVSLPVQQAPPVVIQQPQPVQPAPLAPQPMPVVAQPQQQQPIQLLQTQQTGINTADVKCRRFLDQPPNPPFNIITGKYANTIENIQFKDSNNNMVESGTGQLGQEFTYKCPDSTNIVGYDINNQGKERPETSIFGGFGPVYCADGTVVGKSLGKAKTQTIGQRPETELSQYNFVDSNLLPFDDSLLGVVNETNLNQCASVCNFLKDNCGGFSYDSGNRRCGLASSVDRARIQPQTGGRTYQKMTSK